jgi:O-antigen ligase
MMIDQKPYDGKTLTDRKLYALAVLWLFVLTQNEDLSSHRLIWWGGVALFVGTYLLSYRFQVYFDNYSLWIIGFTFLGLTSAIWAITPAFVYTTIKSMVVHIVIFVLLKSSIRTKKDVEFLLKLLLVACVINAVYLFFANMEMFTEQTQEIGDRLGTQEGWNANSVGMMTSVGAILALYFYRNIKKKKGKLLKFLLILAIVFLAVLSLLTGSRKAVIILMGGIAAYIFLSSKGKRIRALLFCILVILLLWYVVMEVPYFYSTAGWRIEAFLSQFTGEGELDSSTKARQTLIAAAVDAWLQKPIFGHGLDCFRYFGQIATGRNYYAHNNYLEILADLGIVGLVTYYGAYLHIFIQSWRKRADKLSLLFFVLICVMLVTEYACVTYESVFFGTLIVLMFANIKLRNAEEIRK